MSREELWKWTSLGRKLVKKKPVLASEILIQRKRECVCACVSARLCTRKWVNCQVLQPLETCISLLFLGACSVWCIVQKSTQWATSVGNCHTHRSFTALTCTYMDTSQALSQIWSFSGVWCWDAHKETWMFLPLFTSLILISCFCMTSSYLRRCLGCLFL